MHCSPLVHQVSRLITKGYKIGQACHPFLKSVLTTLSPPFIVLHMPGHAFQDQLLDYLPGVEVRLTSL